MAEMTATEYLKTKARMIQFGDDGVCTIECDNCQLFSKNNGKEVPCDCFENMYPEEAVDIIQKWADVHPKKTMMQDFFEKYPNAPRRISGEPLVCPESLGYRPEDTGCHAGCDECRNRPLEE